MSSEKRLSVRSEKSDVLLWARDVHFGYRRNAPAVSGVSVAIRRGSFGGLIGANGSGKSTLLRLLAGILRPTDGEVRLDGRAMAASEPRERAKRIAYVPQSQTMVLPFTAIEVVLTGRSPHGTRFRFESERDLAIAREALETVDALHLANRPVTELSGGERQLVSVARALAQQADVVLLDEPSASLDLKHRAQLIRTLRRSRDERGLTVLVVTHDLQLLEPAFEYLLALRGGRVCAQGSPGDVLRATVLKEVYGDEHVHAQRVSGRTFVWSEA